MGNLPNPKILGATLVGLALVGGAYAASGQVQPATMSQTASSPDAPRPLERVAIAVEDRDNNGIEDWRDAFVTNEPVVISRISEEYVFPETLTGQASVQLLQGLLESRVYAPIAPDDETVIRQTFESFDQALETKTFSSRDLEIIEDFTIEDVVNYANTVAATIYRHDVVLEEDEIQILNEVVSSNSSERIPELETIAGIYTNYVADSISIPVPRFLVKQHLDLLNSYQAVAEDITGMTTILDDPLQGLAYTQRYLNSTAALRISLTNIYFSLTPFADNFTVEDPALLFVLFSPDYQPEL